MKNYIVLFLLFSSYIFSQESSFDPDQLIGKKQISLEGTDYQLLPEAAKAFEAMNKAALAAGFCIRVVSSYRSYERQRAIWNRKYRNNQKEGLSPDVNRQKIIEYSTLPGTSRHHWGSEIDIVDANIPPEGDVLLSEKFHNEGPYEPLRLWLEAHAADFGFICAYPDQPDRSGFYYEPWHYSYAPLSVPLYRSYLKLDLNATLQDSLLSGHKDMTKQFLASYRKTHIMGINPALQ